MAISLGTCYLISLHFSYLNESGSMHSGVPSFLWQAETEHTHAYVYMFIYVLLGIYTYIHLKDLKLSFVKQNQSDQRMRGNI